MKPLLFFFVVLVAGAAAAQSQVAADTSGIVPRFVPGTKVLFTDDFRKARTDSVPPRWELVQLNPDIPGLGGVRVINGQKALVLTQGNFAGFRPVLPAGAQLGDAFTIEYDYFQDEAACCGDCG